MEYTVIQAKGIEEFINLVNVHIAQGWQPAGGVCVTEISSGGAYYMQALVKQVPVIVK